MRPAGLYATTSVAHGNKKLPLQAICEAFRTANLTVDVTTPCR